MRILVLVLFGLLWLSSGAEAACSGSGTTWSCTAGTTTSQVQSAVNSAPDGTTLTFAAGSYSWNSTITLSNTKGMTFICASIRACVVTVTTGNQIFYFDTLSGNNTRIYRISGFYFQNAPSGAIFGWIYGPGTLNNLQVDNNTFHNFGSGATIFLLGEQSTAGNFRGVFNNNIIDGPSNYMLVKLLGCSSGDCWGPSPKGTANNLYFEDNQMLFTTASDLSFGCIDIWSAAAVVWRYNVTQNCLVTAHGVVHNSGAINFELYGNTLVRTAGSGGSWENGTRLFHHQGSGETIAFNNTFTAVGAVSSEALAMTHYRSASPGSAGYSTSLGRCDGSQSIDGNMAPASTNFGYPCWRQPGRDGSGRLQPMYVWNNRWSNNGSKVDMAIENPWGQSNPSVQDHIKPNRDFYNAVSASAQTSPTSPFNGSTGMGFGTLANRPPTCTTGSESGGGVGYFATDAGSQGTLFRCSSANTWTVQYTPYTYPHPLRSGTGGGGDTNPPSAPTNLRVQ